MRAGSVSTAGFVEQLAELARDGGVIVHAAMIAR